MSFQEYLKEVLSNQLKYLEQYLKMDERSQDINRALSHSYWIDEFLSEEEHDESIDEFENDSEKVEWLESHNPELLVKYGQYVKGIPSYNNDSEMELYDIVTYQGFVRQKWLIHFSDDAYSIAKDQNFKKGTPYEDYQRLGLSTHFRDISKTGGFNFAYEVKDVEKYYKERRNSRPKYGKEAVIFKGDGIKVWHYGDQEPQVIFDGKVTTKPIIYVEYNEDDKWRINSTKTGEKIIEKEKIKDIINWVEQNYSQYQKHLEGGEK